MEPVLTLDDGFPGPCFGRATVTRPQALASNGASPKVPARGIQEQPSRTEKFQQFLIAHLRSQI